MRFTLSESILRDEVTAECWEFGISLNSLISRILNRDGITSSVWTYVTKTGSMRLEGVIREERDCHSLRTG